MKRNHGITLVALVITIIILIILAGVSINIVLGDNGIISKAKQTKKIQDIARILEKLELEKAEVAIKNGNIVRLDTYLQHIQNKGIIEENDILDPWNIVDGTCYILVEDKYTFLIEQQGNDLKITYVENPVILKLETKVALYPKYSKVLFDIPYKMAQSPYLKNPHPPHIRSANRKYEYLSSHMQRPFFLIKTWIFFFVHSQQLQPV